MHIDFTDNHGKLTAELETLLQNILQHTAKDAAIHAESELSVVLVSNEQIKQLNHDYRHHNEPTDVLSFPLLEQADMKAYDGSHPIALGDIVISIEQAEMQAKEYNHSLQRELAFLAVHGFLHLLGYTHDTEANERVMFAKQEAILKEFNLER